MILKKLFEAGCFNYERFILRNLKPLSLSAKEAVVLVKIIDCYQESDIFDKEKISNSVTMRKDSFEKALSSLFDKNYYNIYLKEEKGIAMEALSVEGFFDKAEAMLSASQPVADASEISAIMNAVTVSFNRVLTGTEIDIINSLVNEDKYSRADFEKALKALEGRRVVNIKTLANELEKERNKAFQKKDTTPDFVNDFINNIK